MVYLVQRKTPVCQGVYRQSCEAAKRRAHVTSDTELLELALSRLALEDDFGVRLVKRKGSVRSDIDLEI